MEGIFSTKNKLLEAHLDDKKRERNTLHSFKELSTLFEERFNVRHFATQPEKLYDASQYLLTVKGKRIRPVMCLMGNELFGVIH
jgi:geranylgeranyl pyrophosphate synthase